MLNSSNSANPAIDARQVNFRYGQQIALDCLDLTVSSGQIFALLGPNGSGKTTFFRLLSTLEKLQRGSVVIAGHDLSSQAMAIRRLLGVVFQSPSLDRKLTVLENLKCQAVLYGISGQTLRLRIEHLLKQFGLQDRLHQSVDTLSGGLRRRVELAKGILHQPQLLLLDEPSTGLDPAARLDLWHALEQLRHQGVTVLMTTHLLEEADKADSIAILDKGKIVAQGGPEQLRAELGSQILIVQTAQAQAVCDWLANHHVSASVDQHQVRASGDRIASVAAPLMEEFGEKLHSITIGKPSLEDLFILRTGHRFWDQVEK